jgi:hypothetical protein
MIPPGEQILPDPVFWLGVTHDPRFLCGEEILSEVYARNHIIFHLIYL